MDALLTIRGLTVRFYTYEGVVRALENIDLDINRKETFGLVGETGCGKTLTALSILRLVPPPGRIESGQIIFDIDGSLTPTDLLTISEAKMREIRGSKISMVFQEPSAALNPVFTIGDQISEVMLIHRQKELSDKAVEAVSNLLATRKGFFSTLIRPIWLVQRELYRIMSQKPGSLLIRIIKRIPLVRRLLWRIKDESEKMAIVSLKEVEIPDAERVMQQYPHQMSGGMKQRAVIAAALACSPRFLIADEPTTSLDVTIQAQILDLLRRLKDEMESSVLYITHDLAVAAELCDRIGVMYAGSLCEVASVNDIYTNPLHPYTVALMAAVPRPGQEPQAIGGTVPDPLSLPPGCKFHPRCSQAMPVCQEQVPQMLEQVPGHFIACHLYRGEASGSSG
jgi:peptide/nickel transport system ATP-binding protein